MRHREKGDRTADPEQGRGRVKQTEKATEIGTNKKIKSHCRNQWYRAEENTTEQNAKHDCQRREEREAQRSERARGINGAVF